jgi:hypothetical protein
MPPSFGRSIPLRRHEIAILGDVVADASLTVSRET